MDSNVSLPSINGSTIEHQLVEVHSLRMWGSGTGQPDSRGTIYPGRGTLHGTVVRRGGGGKFGGKETNEEAQTHSMKHFKN